MAFIFLLIFIPVSLILAVLKVAPLWIFFSAILAIVPLAVWIQRGTEQITLRVGPSIGGLLNASFGNAAELILALFVLMEGHSNVVKGQIIGSILSNSLLGLGLAILVGTWGKKRLQFNRDRAGLLSTLLILVTIGLLLPAIFNFTEQGLVRPARAFLLDERLSLAVSGVLILIYIGNLIFTLITHDDVFSANDNSQSLQQGQERENKWPLWRALVVLVAATIGTALEAELVSGALEQTAGALGVSIFFLGVVVLAVIGNIAEFISAIYFARQGNMDLAMPLTVGSTVQVALFVAPLLVFLSYWVGKPMDLVFNNPIELVGIFGVAFTVNAISRDGQVTWFEGMLLIGVYVLMAIAFFLLSPG